MKKGLSIITSCMLLLSLSACGGDGEEEIVYEESPFPLPGEYTIPSGDTAPAYYSNVLTAVSESTVSLEGQEIYNENGELIEIPSEDEEESAAPAEEVELTKAEIKALEAEQELLDEAYAALQADLDKVNAKISSVRLVHFTDPTEVNNAAVAEATEAYELATGTGEAAEAAPAEEGAEEGATEENLSAESTLTGLEAIIADLEYAPYIYNYDVTTTGKTGGQVTADYVAYMQNSGFKIIDPFHPVNDEYYEMLTPDFTQRAGTVALAKKASGEDNIFMIMVDWNYYGAVVMVYEEDGTLWIAPKKDTAAKTSLTVTDAKNFLQTRTPEQLGLEGASMEEYTVFTSEALLIVNGVTYRQFTITRNPINGNGSVFGGNYLVDADGNTYVLNSITGTITPLQITNIFDTIN